MPRRTRSWRPRARRRCTRIPNAMPVTASGQTRQQRRGCSRSDECKTVGGWCGNHGPPVRCRRDGSKRNVARRPFQLFGFGAGARVLGKAAKDGVAYLLRNNQYAQRLYVAELNAGLENAVSAGNSTSGYLTATSKPAGFYGGGTGLGRTGVGCNGMGGCGGTCGRLRLRVGFGDEQHRSPASSSSTGWRRFESPGASGDDSGLLTATGDPLERPDRRCAGRDARTRAGPAPVSVPGQVVGVQPQTPHIPGYVSLPGGGGVKPSFNLPAGFNFRGGGGAPTNAPTPRAPQNRSTSSLGITKPITTTTERSHKNLTGRQTKRRKKESNDHGHHPQSPLRGSGSTSTGRRRFSPIRSGRLAWGDPCRRANTTPD